jgi:hypothetical protein
MLILVQLQLEVGLDLLRANPTATVTTAQLPSGIVSATIVVARCYVYFATLPNAEMGLIAFKDAGGIIGGAYFQSSDNKVYARGGTGLLGATGIAVSTGNWYRIDVKFDASSNPRLIDVQVNGVACGQRSDGFASTTITNVPLLTAESTWTGDVYADDFVISQTSGDYPIGGGYVKPFCTYF